MGIRINRGIFQFQEGDTFVNKFKLAEDGTMVDVDAEGTPTNAYLKIGDTATNADTLDGFHATNAAGGVPVLNSSNGYWYAPSWIHLNEGRGIFSTHNGAHLLPNNQGQYGAWRMIGTRNGWEGLHFGGSSGVTLMMNETESGVHRNGVGWKYRHQSGNFYVYTGTNGGGTGYPVWHEGNLTPISYATGSFTVGGDPETYYPVMLNKSSRTTGRFVIYRDNVHQNESNRGAGRLVLNGYTSGWGHVPLTLHYETKISGSVLWKFLASNYRTGLMVVYLKGATTYYYKSEHGFTLHDANGQGEAKSDGRTNWLPTPQDDSSAAWEGEGPSVLTIEHGVSYYDGTLKAGRFKGDGTDITNVNASTATTATTAANLGSDYTADDWFRATGDNNHVKFYGNSRQMLWRTDGTTETYSGIGGYPFVWTYNGSSSGNRIMILHTDGRLWTGRYGWLDEAFETAGAAEAVNVRIEEEILPAIDSKLGATAKAADSNLLDGIDSSRFLYTTSGQFSGDWNTLTDSNQEIRLVEVHNITGGAHSNHPTGLYTYGSVLGWQLDNSTFKLYSSHTGDLAFQTGWNNDGYSGWRTIWHSANFNPSSYLTTSGKAADSNLLDGIDSSAFIRENQDRAHKIIRFTGESGNSGNTAQNYAIYQAGGAWTYPFPDLVIAMHTGIKIGGYKNYGGVRIYNDAPERSGAEEVASFGNGDANVRVSNNLYIGSAGGWITDLLNGKETAGAAEAVNLRIEEEILPAIDGKLGSTAKATNSHAADGVNIGGYGTNEFSFYQTSGAFAGFTGWANYFIGNHGSGSSYYNTIHIMPFWGPPQYSRLESGTLRGPYTYWTTENFNPTDKASTESVAAAQTAAITHTDNRLDSEILPIIDSKLDATGKAADADKLDGYDWMQSGKSVRANEFYADNWFRNYNSNEGLYNEATTQHWYSDGDDYWNIAGGGSFNAIRFRDEHNGTQRGLVGADSSNRIGFLDAGGAWAVRHDNDSGTLFYTDGETLEFRVGRDKVTGDYGTVQADTNKNGWGGYSIYGQYVLMSNGSRIGIYNDIDNEWMIQCYRNAQVELRHNGAIKLETTSGGVSVTGAVTATTFSGGLDWANVTNKPVIPAATEPVQAIVEGGNNSTLSSITFSEGEGAATFTLADGQSFRLAFAR